MQTQLRIPFDSWIAAFLTPSCAWHIHIAKARECVRLCVCMYVPCVCVCVCVCAAFCMCHYWTQAKWHGSVGYPPSTPRPNPHPLPAPSQCHKILIKVMSVGDNSSRHVTSGKGIGGESPTNTVSPNYVTHLVSWQTREATRASPLPSPPFPIPPPTSSPISLTMSHDG